MVIQQKREQIYMKILTILLKDFKIINILIHTRFGSLSLLVESIKLNL